MKMFAMALVAMSSMIALSGCATKSAYAGPPIGEAFVSPTEAQLLPIGIQRYLTSHGETLDDVVVNNEAPFTAEEIHKATVDGLELTRRTRVVDPLSGEIQTQKLVFRFEDPNEESVMGLISTDGGANFMETSRLSWAQLVQDFDLGDKVLRCERRRKLSVDGDEHDCIIYVGDAPAFDGKIVAVFSKEMPGMPAYLYLYTNGVAMTTNEIIKREIKPRAQPEEVETVAEEENTEASEEKEISDPGLVPVDEPEEPMEDK